MEKVSIMRKEGDNPLIFAVTQKQQPQPKHLSLVQSSAVGSPLIQQTLSL